MARIVVTGPADADAAEILAELARQAGYLAAARYNRRFDALYARLAAHSEAGALRPKLGRDIRIGIVAPYIVIYRYAVADATVSILRIVHGHRRITHHSIKGGS